MKIKEKRISSYVDKGNQFIAEGKMDKAIKEITKGLNFYTNNIIQAIQPYAVNDAGLLVLALRTVADQIEEKNDGARELYDGLKEITIVPEIKQTEKIRRPNIK